MLRAAVSIAANADPLITNFRHCNGTRYPLARCRRLATGPSDRLMAQHQDDAALADEAM